jgi:hypothetical protein
VLEPAPAVEGTVVFADGTPVADLELMGEMPGQPHPCAGNVWMQGYTLSRADGTFRLLLPREGDCTVRPADEDRRVACRTGDRNVRLVVRGHRLRVFVVDADGKGLPGLVLAASSWDAEHAGRLDDLLAGRLTPEEARAEADLQVSTLQRADGLTNLIVPRGSAWLFRAHAPGAVPAEVPVRVPAEGNESEVRIVIRPQVGGGRLQVRVRDPDDKPVPFARVTVETTLGSHLARGPVAGDALLGPYPPGSVRITARPIRDLEDRGWEPGLDTWMLEASTTATVRDGATVELPLRAAWGGRLRIMLRSATPSGSPGADFGARAVPLAGGQPEFLMMQKGPPEDGVFSSNFDADVPSLASTLLPPGTYRLEVAARGHGWGKPAAQRLVTVVGREITDVVLDLAK